MKKMAERTGLEPATPGVTGRYSNQLNYRSEFWGANANGLMNKATSSFVPAARGPATCPARAADRPRGPGRNAPPAGDGTRPELPLNAPKVNGTQA